MQPSQNLTMNNHSRVSGPRFRVAALPLLLSITLAACSGGSSPGDGGGSTGGGTTGSTTATTGGTTASTTGATTGETTGETTGGTTGGTTGSTTGETTGGTTGDSNPALSLLDAGLSHTGSAVVAVAAVTDDPLISNRGRDAVAALGNNPAVFYEVVSNQGTSLGLDCSALGAQYNSCSVVNLHLKDDSGALNGTDWRLYFHSKRRLLQLASDDLVAGNVNGDLYYLEPADNYSGLGGSTRSIRLIVEYNQLVESDFQPRYWLHRNGTNQLISNTTSETDIAAYASELTGNNRYEYVGEPNELATAQNRYSSNSDIATIADGLSANEIQARIVPRPTTITASGATLDISGGISFASLPLPAGSIAALTTRQNQFIGSGNGVSVTGSIDAALPANSYTLDVDGSGIQMAGSDASMLFYAAQSVLSLVQPGVSSIPHVNVVDSPRFDFRGIHIDVARHFHSVASMRRLIDQLAAYKMNKLHLHLSDDEGWRLQIPSLPELTTVGARREFRLDADGNPTETDSLLPAMGSGPTADNQGSGFYSRAEYVDLLRYAADRYIEVIPELDMPAHARAAVVAMRARARNLGDAGNINVRLDDPADDSRYRTVQNYYDSFINPCVPGTYNFIRTIVTDIRAMYTEAGLPFDIWHMGGDEAFNIFKGFGFNGQDTSDYDFPWEQSPVCQQLIADNPSISSLQDLTPYFIQQVAQIVADTEVPALYAYQDIYGSLTAAELATTRAGVGFWAQVSQGNGFNSANDFANRGFETVIAVPDYLYFDFPYEVDPKERGYYWAARQSGTRKVFTFSPENLPQNAETSLQRSGAGWSATGEGNYPGYLGMQGQLWSETVRNAEQFDYMLFPRLLALAERAWHRADWELDYVAGRTFSDSTNNVDRVSLNTDYATFAAALGTKEMAKLDAAGVQYRIPVPGATTDTGSLQMNINLPGLPLEYTQDNNTWAPYNPASPPNSAAAVRARTANGARLGRAVAVE